MPTENTRTSYTRDKHFKLSRLLASLIKSVLNTPKRGGVVGSIRNGNLNFLSVYSKVVKLLLKYWNGHTVELMLIRQTSCHF